MGKFGKPDSLSFKEKRAPAYFIWHLRQMALGMLALSFYLFAWTSFHLLYYPDLHKLLSVFKSQLEKKKYEEAEQKKLQKEYQFLQIQSVQKLENAEK